MDDVRFAEPITLKFQSSERKVASSWEAIECMRQQWPDRARGRSWRGLSDLPRRARRLAHRA
ncbi:DUF982 domain-containing protein [Mesorhizobium sp. M0019]|uniref:DUF982 domain-containing protein n=1 Tax=Mesorhizobium sp. M0019 TaxID=2956845 RepID=UPI00333DE9F3